MLILLRSLPNDLENVSKLLGVSNKKSRQGKSYLPTPSNVKQAERFVNRYSDIYSDQYRFQGNSRTVKLKPADEDEEPPFYSVPKKFISPLPDYARPLPDGLAALAGLV